MKLSVMISVLSVSLWISNATSREEQYPNIIFTQNDVALLDALIAEDKKKFVHYLELGGDPTVRFDNTQFGWAYCAATIVGFEEYLELIIENGYGVNFRQSDISSEISLPLACAVRSNNLEAIKILVNAGANPSESVCIRCGERFPSSLLSESVLVRKFNIANWLIENGTYSYRQLETVVNLIERFPLPKSSSKIEEEIELVSRLRGKGMVVSYDVK